MAHFRRNNSKKTRGHPTYIYKRVGNTYHYVGITHSPITRGTKNVKLNVNPNPNDSRDSYIRPFSSEDSISDFQKKRLIGWKLNPNDKPKIKQAMKRHKK